MKTLDELLSERAQQEYQAALTQVLDPGSWTVDNRDSKMQDVRTLAEQVCSVSEAFVKELLETKLEDGNSVLWHKIREQFIRGELELLMGFRDELDTVMETSEGVPVDYNWLTAQIKKRYLEIANNDATILKAMNPEGEVNEL